MIQITGKIHFLGVIEFILHPATFLAPKGILQGVVILSLDNRTDPDVQEVADCFGRLALEDFLGKEYGSNILDGGLKRKCRIFQDGEMDSAGMVGASTGCPIDDRRIRDAHADITNVALCKDCSIILNWIHGRVLQFFEEVIEVVVAFEVFCRLN